MSTLQDIYSKMTPALETTSIAHMHPELPYSDNQKQIGREVAHDLNNILTIIRGYADRMLIKHGDNAALRSDLQIITENVKRADALIRQSTAPRARSVTIVGG
ncbi:MAG TPA: histidine kinase dimerization/phospho-acceptor domain-containing protein [bacterium]|nr:histidine kinase dimerization/phospho-acceptor domain-containing protein [bacterium]